MKEKLNKTNFIEKAREVHGYKYNYDKVNYIKAKEKVIITCPKHGDFELRPLDHILKACGCPKCKAEKLYKYTLILKSIFWNLLIKYMEINMITPRWST